MRNQETLIHQETVNALQCSFHLRFAPRLKLLSNVILSCQMLVSSQIGDKQSLLVYFITVRAITTLMSFRGVEQETGSSMSNGVMQWSRIENSWTHKLKITNELPLSAMHQKYFCCCELWQ